ncbi:MAG TPA: outer membrane protein assembly factor BamC [Gammaproteobacteria bacterium]|nr:outer membrane protein assembly factor BamC [Gammaproteobacteria bacterium]
MMNIRKLAKSGIIMVLALTLGACNAISSKLDEVTSSPDQRTDYKKSQSLPPLEIPPDLTSSTIDDTLAVPDIDPAGTATLSTYNEERKDPQARATENVLPQQDNIRLERDGDKRWLVITGEPDQIWPKVREFFLQSGFLIKQEDPRIGILETDWLENRADIPKDPIRSILSKAFDSLYSSATRDKYRIRLERGKEAGTTELYLSHRGVEEVVQGTSTIWQARPSDPELEAEMLNRLVVSFGVDEQKAKAMTAKRENEAPRAQLTRDGDGNAFLSLEEDFSRAWRRTGLALDRVGFTVEDRDRSRGLYYVRYIDPLKDDKKSGFLSKLKFWGDDKPPPGTDQYLISVASAETATRIVILNKDGAPEKSDTSDRILTLLQEQLK